MPYESSKRMKLEIPNRILADNVEEVVSRGYSATIPLRGYSMRPFLEDKRDKAVLTKVEYIKKNDVVLAHVGNKYMLHRIIAINGENITLLGDGNITPEHCLRNDIIAIAIGFYRKGRKKMDSTHSVKWKLYSAIWTRLLPIRRYLLFVYRHVNL